MSTDPRLSTAVVLTREGRTGLEVLLVRRNPTLRFFGGYWAFPGGTIDEQDRDGELDGDASHRRCAARELFEETGVLLLSSEESSPATEQREEVRSSLLAEEEHPRWSDWLDGGVVSLGMMRPFARLTTPAFAPVRYRTRFVHAELPAGEALDIREGELVDGRFVHPSEFLEEWRNGGLLVAPPVLHLLEILAGKTVEDFLEAATRICAANEAGALHAIRNTPGIRMAPLLTPTIPPATTTNAYVVGEKDLFVVDPAPYDEGERRRLLEFLARLESEGRRVRGVLVTHHHQDHVGAIDTVATKFGVPVHGHPLTLERLPVPPRDPRPLDEGSRVELGVAPDGSEGWHLLAHHTPGHDRGHLIFIESRYRAAIVGDLVSTLSTIVIDPPEGHMATYVASLERARGLELAMLYPAHGPANPRGRALLGRAIEHRQARERKVLEALSDEPQELGQVLARAYDDVDPRLTGLAERSLLAGLEKLEEEGQARSRGSLWSLA